MTEPSTEFIRVFPVDLLANGEVYNTMHVGVHEPDARKPALTRKAAEKLMKEHLQRFGMVEFQLGESFAALIRREA